MLQQQTLWNWTLLNIHFQNGIEMSYTTALYWTLPPWFDSLHCISIFAWLFLQWILLTHAWLRPTGASGSNYVTASFFDVSATDIHLSLTHHLFCCNSPTSFLLRATRCATSILLLKALSNPLQITFGGWSWSTRAATSLSFAEM